MNVHFRINWTVNYCNEQYEKLIPVIEKESGCFWVPDYLFNMIKSIEKKEFNNLSDKTKERLFELEKIYWSYKDPNNNLFDVLTDNGDYLFTAKGTWASNDYSRPADKIYRVAGRAFSVGFFHDGTPMYVREIE